MSSGAAYGALRASRGPPWVPGPLAPLPAAPAPAAPVRAATVAAVQPASGSALVGFAGYKVRLAALARTAGVRETTIQSVIPYLSLDSRAIRLDRAQPGQVSNPNATPPFAPYRRCHVNNDLIRRGAAKYREHYSRLMWVECLVFRSSS